MQTFLATALGALMLFSFAALPAKASDVTQFMADYYQAADSRPFNIEAVASYYADDFVDHDAHEASEGSEKSAKSHKDTTVELYASLAVGAPDSHHEITFIEPVGDTKALVRWKFKGTHTGTMLGIPPTGKSFDIAGMELWDIKDGKIVSLWHVEDIAKLLQQLGLAH